ncbi:MAG: acetyl-CoA carboxylase carboxyltransferase subunit alpha [Clostridium sp.]|nr:acetyl-CoA carboxylase carboxyltransferase subunit alpha [Clostridium sp.]
MKLDHMFKKTKQMTSRRNDNMRGERHPSVPRGLLRKCNKCGSAIIAEDAIADYYICPKCGGYFRVDAYSRIARVADEASFTEWDNGLASGNPMAFRGYEEKIRALQEKTGLDEAVVTGEARIGGHRVVLGVCDGRFMMASMGEVVGEKIARAVERATKEKLPVILFACSGGARMQEGIVSLMQMAKTAAALKRHSDAGLLYISVLTDPTTGGVTASFAMLGDIILAEPKALIGFAGPRVIEQTIGEKLPKGFQRAEFLLAHGFIDGIVERDKLRDTLGTILRLHDSGNLCREPLTLIYDEADERGALTGTVQETTAADAGADMHEQLTERAGATGCDEQLTEHGGATGCDEQLTERGGVTVYEQSARRDRASAQLHRRLDAWERVQLSRRNDRPVGSDYISALFDDFVELHGDRCFADDKAVIGGIALFHGIPVTVIAQAKGSNTKENIERHFGMPSPEGYRKALRLMRQAEKFHRPVICFVDTPGAFCGLEAEERGQGEAIARSIYEMSALKTPVVSLVIGEGGSGGALAMATADEVWMLENAVYSILSPEGFASILWKDSKRAKEAAAVMRMTAEELKEQGIIELVFEEPEQYTTACMQEVTERLDRELRRFLEQYGAYSIEELTEHRYARFRRI